MNSGPPGHGEGVTSSTSGFDTLVFSGKFSVLKADPAHVWAGSRIPVNSHQTKIEHEIRLKF